MFFFFKQKTAYEIVSGDWSSDVCSSDLRRGTELSLKCCAGESWCGSVGEIRAARRERCRVAVRLRQRPNHCRLNCCASIQSTRKPKRCAMRRTFSRAEV